VEDASPPIEPQPAPVPGQQKRTIYLHIVELLSVKWRLFWLRIRGVMWESGVVYCPPSPLPATKVLNGPGVDQSRLEQSGFSSVQCTVFLDWAWINLTFHHTGSDSLDFYTNSSWNSERSLLESL
jgi:hypothetical protein